MISTMLKKMCVGKRLQGNIGKYQLCLFLGSSILCSDLHFFRMRLNDFDQCMWACLKWIRRSDSFSNDLCNGNEVVFVG